jgi:hypothetical protein
MNSALLPTTFGRGLSVALCYLLVVLVVVVVLSVLFGLFLVVSETAPVGGASAVERSEPGGTAVTDARPGGVQELAAHGGAGHCGTRSCVFLWPLVNRRITLVRRLFRPDGDGIEAREQAKRLQETRILRPAFGSRR